MARVGEPVKASQRHAEVVGTLGGWIDPFGVLQLGERLVVSPSDEQQADATREGASPSFGKRPRPFRLESLRGIGLRRAGLSDASGSFRKSAMETRAQAAIRAWCPART
jgi:hypothetical protein